MFPTKSVPSEAITGERTTVQAPYFNTFAPWIGLGLIVAIAVGNLMRYQTDKIPRGKLIMGVSAVLALPLAFLLIRFGDVMHTPMTKKFALAAQVVGAVSELRDRSAADHEPTCVRVLQAVVVENRAIHNTA